MSALDDMITGVRTGLDDSTTSKFVQLEDLSAQMAGTNKIFSLAHRPLVAGSYTVRVDGVVLTITTQFTVDDVKGLITLASAPTSSINVDYNWYDFSDSQITDFINGGLQDIGYSSGLANVATDILTVPQPLLHAVEHYATYHGAISLVAKTARLFDAGAGKKHVSKMAIAKKYQDLAEFHSKEGDRARDSFYQRQGRRLAPSAGSVTMRYPTNTPRS